MSPLSQPIEWQEEDCFIAAWRTDDQESMSTNACPQLRTRRSVLISDRIWLGTRQQLDKLDPESLTAEFPTFLFSTSVRDLGVILDQELSFGEHITALNRSCYYHLRQLRVVSRSLSSSSASTLVHAFIANRLDYCSSLYCGLPQVRLRPLNGILRVAARMIGGVPKFGHISDYMRDVLHWLPVQQRIHYRISSIVWHCVLGNAPSYLLELFS